MEAERWRRIQQLYHSALELDKSRWAAFVEVGSEGDEELAREVKSLLAHSEETGGRRIRLLTFAPFFWRLGDDLTAIAHKHLISNDIA